MLGEISENTNLDHNLKLLPKLVNAKNAACAIMRAAKKNDFMLLKSDACTEVDNLKFEVPQITSFASYIQKKRLKHKAAHKQRIKQQ